MRFILCSLMLIFCLNPVYAFPTLDIKSLWEIPTKQVKFQLIKEYEKGPIKVEEVYYQSRPYKEHVVNIFGYFCYPKEINAKLPAILLVHGGGGTASLARSVAWAQRGYAVMTIDLPGHGEKRLASRSGGPDMDVPILLRTFPNPSYNYLVHAVAATRNAITFLSQRKEVDPKRIGMVGLSWGGVITLLTNGQDQRLKTAINVFGAGYIPEGCTWGDRFENMGEEELNLWYSLIDPKNFLKSQHAPILFLSGTNDHCYYLPTFQKSYDEVMVPKRMVLIPNLRHRFLADEQSIVWNWLDYQLKYNKPFPEVYLHSVYSEKNRLIVAITTEASVKIIGASLYLAAGQPNHWTQKKWTEMKGYYEDGYFYFGIPLSNINPEILFYVTVKDKNGAVASTPIRSIFKVGLAKGEADLALSSAIKKVNIHEMPLRLIGALRAPAFRQMYFSKKNRIYQLIGSQEASSPNTNLL